ncbi:MAG: undecaprenyl-diphosphate phosphatase, partial [Candidatus Bathyarchaeia archaeon]
QKVSRSGGTRTVASLDAREGVVMGLTQGLSAIPGLSRSGLTTSALFLKRYTGGEAFRISFLMSIPATFAAVTGLAVIEGFPRLDTELMVAISASFLSTLFSIDLLLRLARRIRFWGLCIVLGLLALILNAIWLI